LRSGRRSSRGSETPPGAGGPRGRTPRSGEVQVRAARAEDVGSIAALWVALLAYHRDLGEEDIHPSRASAEGRRFIKEHVGTGDRICLVAESGDGAIGFLVGTLRKRSAAFGGWRYGHIYDVYVHGPYRRTGVGRALVEEAVRWFRARGVRRVQLQVRAHNAAGIGFWKGLGFGDLAVTMERRL